MPADRQASHARETRDAYTAFATTDAKRTKLRVVIRKTFMSLVFPSV